MKKILVAGWLAGLLINMLSSMGYAALLYQQPLDGSIKGAYSNIGGQIIADDFSLSTDSIIHEINWWGYFDEDPVSLSSISFDISIHTNVSNLPDMTPDYLQTLSPTLTDTGLTAVNDNTIYKFELTLASPYSVTAGDVLWLCLADNDTGTRQFLWSRSAMSGTYAYRNTNPTYDGK